VVDDDGTTAADNDAEAAAGIGLEEHGKCNTLKCISFEIGLK
jgi:hypothetical protein